MIGSDLSLVQDKSSSRTTRQYEVLFCPLDTRQSGICLQGGRPWKPFLGTRNTFTLNRPERRLMKVKVKERVFYKKDLVLSSLGKPIQYTFQSLSVRHLMRPCNIET